MYCSNKRPLRTLFFGMMGTFSRLPLLSLLASDVAEVVGIVVAQPRLSKQQPAIEPLVSTPALSQPLLLTTRTTPNIAELGWQHNLPVFGLRQPKAASVEATLATLAPDVVCVACFSHRIPKNLLSLPAHGFLNVHPSLLPAFRGPEPLFWLFRHDKEAAGVTIHFMDEGLDSGDIVRQAAIALPDGISGAEADRLCAELGGQLLVETLRDMQAGTVLRAVQGENGRYYPTPTANDFIIPTSWSARHAFNFMRGTAEWGRPYLIAGLDREIWAKTAVSFQPLGQLAQPLVRQNDSYLIQFNLGVVEIISVL